MRTRDTSPAYTLTNHAFHPHNGPKVLLGLDLASGARDTRVEFLRLDQIARYSYDSRGGADGSDSGAVLTIWFVGTDTPMRIRSGVTDRLTADDPLSDLDEDLFTVLTTPGDPPAGGLPRRRRRALLVLWRWPASLVRRFVGWR